MREIKFRGRAIDSGEWAYGFLLLTDVRAYIHPGRDGLDFDDIDFGYGFIQVDPKTIGQFTGLLDKNGKEIYEGDIVASPDIIYGEMDNNLVSYCDGYWYPLVTVEQDYNAIDRYRPEDFEIIGNIHENPELLN